MQPSPRVAAPRPPEPAPPFHFPVVATIAPVIVAVAMWAVTRSPFALMFAALGPVVAIASLADARIQQRRRLRRERARFAADLALATDSVHAAHAAELAALDDVTPAGPALAARTGHDPARWKATPAGPIGVSVGRAALPSDLALEGADPVEDRIADLVALAAVLPGAPLVVDARAGIGVFGPGALPVAAARSIVLQLAWALSPAEHWVRWAGQAADWAWIDSLPHPTGSELGRRPGGAAVEFGVAGDDRPVAAVTVAGERTGLPGAHRVVVGIGRTSAVVAHPDLALRTTIVPELVSAEHALSWALAARSAAEADGLVSVAAGLPGSVRLSELPVAEGDGGLPAVFAITADGPLVLDLAAHGPHAVVGGTTGSGKSELLTSWVLAMAAARSPDRVTFLLVDFKGGSTFAGLATLPHTVGLITDLDETEAERALESLRAELRHRERELAAAGAKDIVELPPGRLARLVVIVDEFAAMMADYPELHGLFSDVAARGRSLGVHLVLCTQRPAAVARDAVLANADLRISLRVNNRADSVAVVGTDAAASVSPTARGRAVVSIAGEPARPVQVALATAADVDRVATLWPGDWRTRRPWCPPLPHLLPFRGPGAFGLLDLPAEQRQEPARYDPVEHGHVIVLGAHRAGRSTALAALAGSVGGARAVPADVEGAWDAIAAVSAPGILVLDDLDALLPRFSDDHRAAFVERLTRLLRDGPAAGIRLLASAQRVTGELQPIVALMPSRLLLRQANRQEHALAGGEPGGFVPALSAGRGEWLGHRVQVAAGAPVAVTALPAAATVTGRRPLAVVSSRPAEFARRLQPDWTVTTLDAARDSRGLVVTTGRARSAIVGDPEEWQSHWGALASLRATSDILFDGCGLADFRALTRSRDLPPPIADPRAAGWLLSPDGRVTRAALPAVD